ncbi:glycosyltransferase family 2 protein [Faecalibacter rhinopitheci]|uniref:Glycosyltransferase n=1 Tax=Faecalibacter rhinopitheci TaxID=2779678 RepID=A0A8J7FW93_9FLAO|nr:glycosyltransferase [Faecalibacter rhinopitheci]MBF0597701.1 glycosyltransferase [Faecalibacter rhinopitheci]
MEKIKISIIIPVYKPGEYIHDCINSLINQTFKEAEFIFVNDGSPDNVLDVLEEYQAKYARIKIITQKNQGISIARNTGLQSACGDYIGFMDNDDYYELDFLENLYNAVKINNLDIVVSRTIEERDEKKLVKNPIFKTNKIYDSEFSKKNFIKNLMLEESLFAVWNKLYKRSMIEEHQIRFPANREIEEDCMFNLQAFNIASKIMFIDYYGYNYREVLTSESRRFIERDLFSKALEKFHFDYKNKFGLQLTVEEEREYKSIRLINRAVYLTFICSNDKSTFSLKYNYIINIIKNKTLIDAVNASYNNPLLKQGKYDTLLRYIIKQQNYTLLKSIIWIIHMVYTPKLSEVFRSLNGTNKNVELIKNEN